MVLNIPPYAEEGQLVREELYGELKQTLGAARFDRFLQVAEAGLDEKFEYFGEADRTLQFETVQDDESGASQLFVRDERVVPSKDDPLRQDITASERIVTELPDEYYRLLELAAGLRDPLRPEQLMEPRPPTDDFMKAAAARARQREKAEKAPAGNRKTRFRWVLWVFAALLLVALMADLRNISRRLGELPAHGEAVAQGRCRRHRRRARRRALCGSLGPVQPGAAAQLGAGGETGQFLLQRGVPRPLWHGHEHPGGGDQRTDLRQAGREPAPGGAQPGRGHAHGFRLCGAVPRREAIGAALQDPRCCCWTS